MTSLTKSILEKIISSTSKACFKENYFVKLLASEGQIFVIAVPTVRVAVQGTPYNNYWWSPVTLDFEREKGDSIEEVNDEFPRYFNNVKSWNFTMDFHKGVYLVGELTMKFPRRVLMYKLVQTRYRAAIGIQLLLPTVAARPNALPSYELWHFYLTQADTPIVLFILLKYHK